MKRRLTIALLCGLVTPAAGYGVGPAVALEELAKTADIVCKATATSTKKLAGDASLERVTGFPVYETAFRTISCLKGTAPKKFKFRHYAYDPSGSGIAYSPQHYELTPGRTYVVFARGSGGVYRPLFNNHTQKEDQGVLRTGDAKPLQGTTATDAIWAELEKMIASARAADAAYAIEQLDEMSGGGFTPKLHDFDRQRTLAEIRPRVQSNDLVIAEAAIGVFGGDSPFYVETDAPYWLAGAGKGTIAGLSPRKAPATVAADAAIAELTAVANSGAPKLRPLAIRALGKTRAITLGAVAEWNRDANLEVRRASIIVSSQLADHSFIAKAVTDNDARVRRTAAIAAGFAQDPQLLSQLGKLLGDADPKVREGAAMAVLSFAPDVSAPLMKAQLSSDYMPLFVNVLARKDPKPYLAQLAIIIEKRLEPKTWWGGRIPAVDSWEILFTYLKARPVAELSKAPLDGILDSLERMKWTSSSEARDLYAFYIRRGLTVRAKQFRDTLKTTAPGAEAHLDEADKHPERFVP